MSRHNDYDAHRHLSSSKAGVVAPKPKLKRKSLRVGTVLTWMAYAVIVAVVSYIFRSAL